ncbi:elongation factor G [Eggerthellaceae bacterium zg-1084]|uniref:Elongation factor G n=1 Tax=Berryella wangjianweii TaxID=2734634 RepID=A0A6M8IZV6_9ACTN|nr:elongation factor G [Berryella wangjianweii]NPD31305.1 elongation factor G [Berryella wangjianweii]NPD32386.1 elongation factor G [Eggerthellaceae bacterium zg-997]QKF06847.1 elongation factor G [Berryella wangjianweii]
MAAPATEHVRNIVLVGQDGAGKTSLAEAMLHVSGRTPRMGTTHDGKSYLDFDEEEIRRKFTISTSVAPIPYRDFKINLLDTSGHPDFIGDTIATMNAAETALFVVDAVAGPQVMTTKLWHEAEDMRISRAVFINHIDRENADFDVAMALLHARFGSRLGPVSIPMGVDADFKGVIDILRMKARYFDADGVAERVEDIPAEYLDAAENARDKLCDLVAEADDELMMKYLEGEERLTQAELESLLGKAIAQELLIPVFVGSTIIEQGIKGVMEDICTYFPHPRDHGAFPLADGTEVHIDEKGDPAAFVFKTIADPFVGRLSYLKVLSGVLEPGQELVCARTGRKERIGHLYVMMGKEATDVKSAKAGDIIVVPKLGDSRLGDTLSSDGSLVVAPLPLPTPQYPVAIEAVNKKEEDKLGTFLTRAVENDPTLLLSRNEETHQTVITAMGDEQVNTLMIRLKEQAGVDARLVPVRIPYRETVTRTASAQGRHKKQTGGSGQFGDCWLRIAPNPGEGFAFIDEIVGGKIPRSYIPAVEKGVVDAMAEGVLAGYPMVDVSCAVYDGSYHSVDSNEMAFKTAARIGFRAACEQAGLVLLEPMATMEVCVPEEHAGAVMGDITMRRGRIVGTDSNDAGDTIVIVRVPYAEVVGYTRELRSISRGSGDYTIELDGYEQAPAPVAKKLVEEYQAARA